MSSSTIRKAIGTMKDHTSIRVAKVTSNTAPALEIAIVKATSHEECPPKEKHVEEIRNLSSKSLEYTQACVSRLSKRLAKTRDWIVAVKTLSLIHHLLINDDPLFRDELLSAKLLNLSNFRDVSHSNSWDHSAFVRTFAMYIDQRLETALHGSFADKGRKVNQPPRRAKSCRDPGGTTAFKEVKTGRIFVKMGNLQRLMDRVLACKPTGFAKTNRLVLVAVQPIVKESFEVYNDICDVLSVLREKMLEMEYKECVKTLNAYENAARQIDGLIGFYDWCKETGVGRWCEYPIVQRITEDKLDALEGFVRYRWKNKKDACDYNDVQSIGNVAHEQIEDNITVHLVNFTDGVSASEHPTDLTTQFDPFAASLRVPPPSFV